VVYLTLSYLMIDISIGDVVDALELQTVLGRHCTAPSRSVTVY